MYPQNGENRRIEHWNVGKLIFVIRAYHQLSSPRLPVIMAERLGGRSTSVYEGPYILECQCAYVHLSYSLITPVPFLLSEGQQLRYCGFGVGFDDVIIKGDPSQMKVGETFWSMHAGTDTCEMQSDAVHRIVCETGQSCCCCQVTPSEPCFRCVLKSVLQHAE